MSDERHKRFWSKTARWSMIIAVLATYHVARAEDWRWSSLREWVGGSPSVLAVEGPIARYVDWLGFVNDPVSDATCSRLAVSVERERPFGEPAWIVETASRFDLGWTLRRPGRPRDVAEIGAGTRTAEK